MTDKLNGIKPGDRVRVEFEGGVSFCSDHELLILQDGRPSDMRLSFAPSEWESPTFQITRIEPELAVGDMVGWCETPSRSYEVIAIKGDKAVLWSDYDNACFSDYLCTLTRVPAK